MVEERQRSVGDATLAKIGKSSTESFAGPDNVLSLAIHGSLKRIDGGLEGTKQHFESEGEIRKLNYVHLTRNAAREIRDRKV